MSKPIEIVVGGGGPYDPAIGTTTCPVSTLKGVEIYVEKAGTGTMAFNSYTPLTNGGFALAAGTFLAGEIYHIHQSGILADLATNNYTNGFNYAQVISALLGRMGWRSSTLANQPVLSVVNTTSKSGRYFNDAHALLTIPNIKSILDNPNMSDNDFNAELEVLQKSVIMRSLTAVYGQPELLEQVMFFERQGHLNSPIVNSGLFVGVQIDVAATFDKAVQIEAATMLFDSDINDLKLYLFKDGKRSPIWSQTVDIVANEATVVDFDNLILNYQGNGTKGRRFHFGYFQTDLGAAKAIREQVDCWNKTLCFCIQAFSARQTTFGAQPDFDRDFGSQPLMPYGMNLQLTSFSDWTGRTVKKPNIFDELNMLTMAAVVIEKLIYCVRINGTERILKDGITTASAIADLNGSAPVTDGPAPIVGLQKRITIEAQRVRKTLFPRVMATAVNLVDD